MRVTWYTMGASVRVGTYLVGGGAAGRRGSCSVPVRGLLLLPLLVVVVVGGAAS